MVENNKNLGADLTAQSVIPSEPMERSMASETTVEFYGDDYASRPRPKKEQFSILHTQLNLEYPQRKGFRREWVLEKLIPDYERRDWRPVKGENGKPMRVVMNSGKYINNLKEPEYGIYYEIPEEYFKQNQAADDSIRKELVERRMNNQDEFAAKEGAGTFVPDKINGLKINNKAE